MAKAARRIAASRGRVLSRALRIDSARSLCLILAAASLSSCVSIEAAPTHNIESLPQAVTVPYRLSSSGRYLIDIAVNDSPAQPFSFDTGATASVIYDEFTAPLGVEPSAETVLVRGLVSIGNRPVIEGLTFNIGPQSFAPDQVVILETPKTRDESIGLLGTDILSGLIVVLNAETRMASFVPSRAVPQSAFVGWRTIPLSAEVHPDTDSRLYFASTVLKDQTVPVLVDTGSNLNFVNWHLATLDDSIGRIEKTLRASGQLQGALEDTALTTETVFNDLTMGRHIWPQTPVVVMTLESLEDVAPVNAPLMIAGSDMLTPWTVAFDFEKDALYIRPNPGDRKPSNRAVSQR